MVRKASFTVVLVVASLCFVWEESRAQRWSTHPPKESTPCRHILYQNAEPDNHLELLFWDLRVCEETLGNLPSCGYLLIQDRWYDDCGGNEVIWGTFRHRACSGYPTYIDLDGDGIEEVVIEWVYEDWVEGTVLRVTLDSLEAHLLQEVEVPGHGAAMDVEHVAFRIDSGSVIWPGNLPSSPLGVGDTTWRISYDSVADSLVLQTRLKDD